MRIQHNIMAMNAYRNYNTNTSALSRNLEKLSSGYKINRAGDDAAGLAISEKMRAQITGLNAAQKNVKDGISLVKTAEGAMQEIQDMLNRMDYLATQSANGTYDNEVDRAALQKEVDQLKSEIDRIADSANFNGIKLLDGSKDGTGASLTTAQATAKAASDAVTAAKADLAKANAMEVAGKDAAKTEAEVKALFAPKADATDTVAVAGTKTILETDDLDAGEVGFQIDFDGVDYVMSGTDTKELTLKIGADETITLSESDIKTNLGDSTLKAGDKISGKDLAKAIAKKLTTANADGTTVTAETGKGYKYKVTAEGTKLKFAALDKQTEAPNRHYDVKLTSDANTANTKTDAVASKYTSGALSADGTITKDDVIKVTVEYKYIGDDGKETTDTKEVSYKVKPDAAGTGTDDDAAAIAKGLVEAINNDADLSKYFVASYTTGDKITLDAQTAGLTNKGAASVTDLTVTGAGTTSQMKLGDITDGEQKAGYDAYTAGLGNSYVNPGTENIVMAGQDGKATLASTTLDLTSVLKDGTLIELGGEKYRIAVGENSAYMGETKEAATNKAGEKVVYVDKKADGTDPGVDAIASKLAQVAKDNATFTVSHETTGGKVGLKQLAAKKDSTDMSTMDKFASYVKISTISEAGDQKIKQDAITAATEKLTAAEEKLAAAEAKVKELAADPGKALQLQIGDTSDKYNQLQVNIGSMKTSALGIADLNIGTPEDASGAIATIKAAINNVSAIRGDLGAYQNRLEHTANNLSVMAENIQDAESTIRDTDVAEEMMAYTKNNILIQSAQAMLAQANAVPQGVLQLLG